MMSAHDFTVLSVELVAMLACALVGGYAMRLINQPAVLGEMLAGILLGPSLLGWLAPEIFAEWFPAAGPVAALRNGTIKIGMLFFLFAVGLEINFTQIARFGGKALSIGLLGSLVPLAGGIAMVYVWPDLWGPQAAAHRFIYGLFIGAAMANTANPVLARILIDLGLMKRDFGAMLMTATIVDDLVGWSLLAAVFSEFAPAEAAGVAEPATGLVYVVLFFAGLLLVGRFIAMPVLAWSKRVVIWPSGFIAVLSILVLVSAAVAEQLKIHAFLGPFLLGVALAPSEEEGRAFEVIDQFVMSFFVPIYFVSMGLAVNFAKNFDLLLVGLVTLVACVTKLASAYAGARITGLDRRTSLAVGFGMNARGAIGIILAALGRENGVINEPVYVALVLMAILTSLMASPAMKMLLVDAPADPQPDAATITFTGAAGV